MLRSRHRGPPLLKGFTAGSALTRTAWAVPCVLCITMGLVFFIAMCTISFTSPHHGDAGASHLKDAVRYRSLWGLPDRTGAGKHGSAIKRPDPVLMKAQIQMPFYTDCFRKPDIVAGAIEASQTCLPLLENNDPTPKFRSQESVVLDASRCQFYLNQTEAARSVQRFLEPTSIRMRANSTDHDVFLQVFCSEDFAFLRQLTQYVPLARPVTVLDAGANVGLATILFAEAIRFNGQVVSVDANPGTMKVLRQNTAYLEDVVLPVDAAIVDGPTAAEKPTMQFMGLGDQYWGFRVAREGWEHPQKVTYDVPTKSLRDLAAMTRSGRFDFIKMDVEGEEKQLLKDPASHAVLCEALCIFMELHERFQPGCVEAFRIFLQKGCGGGQDDFTHVTSSGEYMLFCKASASSSVF